MCLCIAVTIKETLYLMKEIKPSISYLSPRKCSITVKRGHTSTCIRTLEAVSHFGKCLGRKCSHCNSNSGYDVTLLVLSASKFENFMSDAPPSLLHAVRQHVDYALSGIVRTPFFKDIKDVGVLASMFHMKNYEEGYVIFREGEQGTAFYIIIGRMLCNETNDASDTELLATPKKGDFFGEIALLRQLNVAQQLLAARDVVC